jgi:hypothetical protein
MVHGFINQALQDFLRDAYGASWSRMRASQRAGETGFDPMGRYPPQVTLRLVHGAARALGRDPAQILEDFGIWLVADARNDRLRRLLRFGGESFLDFLWSLEDLPGRGRLAIADLDLPVLVLADLGAGRFRLTCQGDWPGGGHVLLGLLRAMADDYGALAVLTPLAPDPMGERLDIHLLDSHFAAGREFDWASAGAAS